MNIFVGIHGFDQKYVINCLGDIVNNETGRKITHQTSCQGYKKVRLKTISGYYKQETIHRAVAKAFVPNPNGYHEVNHIDGDKSNNHFSNLEWCDRSHNIKHSFNSGLRNNIGGNNPMFGKQQTDSAKSKIGEVQRRLTGELRHNARLILNTNTGVFYGCCEDAFNSFNPTFGIKHFRSMLNEKSKDKNKTSFVYC